MLKSTYFMTVIDGVFCLDSRMMYKRETLSVVTLNWVWWDYGHLNTSDTRPIGGEIRPSKSWNCRWSCLHRRWCRRLWDKYKAPAVHWTRRSDSMSSRNKALTAWTQPALKNNSGNGGFTLMLSWVELSCIVGANANCRRNSTELSWLCMTTQWYH